MRSSGYQRMRSGLFDGYALYKMNAYRTILKPKQEGTRFMDITHGTPGNAAHTQAMRVESTVAFPKTTAHNESIQPMLKRLEKAKMHKNLEHFSGFHTRYYKSETGAESSAWLFDRVNSIIEASGAKASARTFAHPWGQNSIIATVPGQSNKTIVVGAHQDSINLFLPSILAAPGADDDGSGTVTILEAFRILLQSDLIAQGNATNTIEFHWYSAEEGGLLGSQAIFKQYEEQHRDVKAMLQQDMTGYTADTIAAGKPVSVGVITDYVDTGLTDFIKEVVKTVRLDISMRLFLLTSSKYCTIPFVDTKW